MQRSSRTERAVEPLSSRAKPPLEQPALRYRMRDLCERTGLSRQAIHFYIREGLVPAGRSLGRNTAEYGEEHVERIQLVRRLQEEHFLPLKAIRALLENRDEAFSPAQRPQIAAVKARLSATLASQPGRPAVGANEAAKRVGVDQKDLRRLVELGLLPAARGPRNELRLAEEDVWLLEHWRNVRRAGFTRQLGFEPDLLLIFEEAVEQMFQKETQILARLLDRLPADRVAAMVERSLGLIDTFLVRQHRTKVRNFFAAT